MEQSGTSTLLQGAVQDIASDVVSALRGGDHVRMSGTGAADDPEGHFALAAVRVLGADLLLPHVLFPTPPAPEALAVFRNTVEAFPPRADAAPTVRWSHWAMRRTLSRFDASSSGPLAGDEDAEPDAAWLDAATWQVLTHQLAVLAPLAVPGDDCAVARAARRRPVDVARGFVRAVRRRDWQQAAGAGRWLTLTEGVPDELGLEAGLDFVELMGGNDPRVALQVQAARVMRAAGALV
ncbi:hypothetical protein ACM01_02010 [Streptomyces viridochromogenes]|uniref:Uncharacterized protein n=1 Tax=Streptomyces viridochromogenes TaxID=1938 RepID=A0A0J7ZN81_STRVR|nr:hypothetical protein [Streptomyces viridochromogenes]KMS77414.1 hypothetical protein ACM01_02010 [Streptomyces viridochromogenes]KOG19138.1 hypothetical protein ADK36_21140 [Streptomyces viridochromogenes]KOG19377.1 hypothetical protein ADK35_21000 [Streptomyces viridochromogenes]